MLEEVIMTEIQNVIKHHDKIYAFMYGFREDNLNHIISIDVAELHFPPTNRSMVYVWGGPGPDYSTYYFEDYGETWAYTKEELIH